MLFAEWVTRERVARKLSQTECARRAGISQPSWQEYENTTKPKQPKKETIEKIVDVFATSPEERKELIKEATEIAFSVNHAGVPAEVVRLWQRVQSSGKEAQVLKAWKDVADLAAA